MVLALVLIFVVLILVAGTALAYATGAAAVLLYLLLDMQKFLAMAPQLVFSQVDFFALMALPLFILVGEIMSRGNVTRVMVDFAMSLMGRIKGGLGHVNVLTSVFFAGISGSAVADAAALSNTLVPAMVERGYSKAYAGAITAASSIIGPLIPPSIIFIFYGATLGVDIAALFAAGIVPGLLLAVALMAANAIFAYRFDHPSGRDDQCQALATSFVNALPALSLPVIIVMGIVFGVMTPTEAAAIAVFAAIGAGLFYRSLGLRDLKDSIARTAVLTGTIFMFFASAGLVIYLCALTQLPQLISSYASNLNVSGTSYLILMVLVFLVIGMVLDTLLALALVAPVLVPTAIAQGGDPVHVGVCLCLTLAIGMITPPLGGSILVVSAVTGCSYWQLFRSVSVFLLVEVVVLLVVVALPGLTLFLPRFFGLM
ncbi:MAG: TRAP transporter large permease [Pseudomonadota bacterium]